MSFRIMDDARRKQAKRASYFRRPGSRSKNCPGRGGPAAAFRSVPASAIDSGIRHARPNLRTRRRTIDEGPRQRASVRRTGGDTAGLTQAAPSATGSSAGHNGAARERHPGAGERNPADAVQSGRSWGTGEVCPSVEMFHAK